MLRFLIVALSSLLLLGGGHCALGAGTTGAVLTTGMAYPLPVYVAGAKARTPESPESMLADDLAARLKRTSVAVKVNGGAAAQWLISGRADVVLLLADAGSAAPAGTVMLPTGYVAGAMAIMRSDTDIRSWAQLKGRTVCLSEGGAYVGTIAARYGAIEKVQRAPADSLLALRTGACDAAVHDEDMLNALLALPEWKKYSARLPVQRRQQLVLAARGDDAKLLASLKQTVADWNGKTFWPAWKKQWVNHVAFEVYLDQNVPDCH